MTNAKKVQFEDSKLVFSNQFWQHGDFIFYLETMIKFQSSQRGTLIAISEHIQSSKLLNITSFDYIILYQYNMTKCMKTILFPFVSTPVLKYFQVTASSLALPLSHVHTKIKNTVFIFKLQQSVKSHKRFGFCRRTHNLLSVT